MNDTLIKLSKFFDCSDLYTVKGRLRADSIRSRNRACHELQEANSVLTELKAQYRKSNVPASTRENPFPPANVMSTLSEFDNIMREIADTEVGIANLEAPSEDKINIKSELNILELLIEFDFLLITKAQDIKEETQKLSLVSITQGWEQPIKGKLKSLIAIYKDRKMQLQYQTY